jgi:hypothetical protein
MRRTIETAPMDGNVVILEDDASGTHDVARWSPEAGEWVGENGGPSKITPTHWSPMPRDKSLLSLLQEVEPSTPFQAWPSASAASEVIASRSGAMAAPATVREFEWQTTPVEAERAPLAWWRFAASSIAATLMVAAPLIGTYFGAEIAAYVTQNADQQDSGGTSRRRWRFLVRHLARWIRAPLPRWRQRTANRQ